MTEQRLILNAAAAFAMLAAAACADAPTDIPYVVRSSLPERI